MPVGTEFPTQPAPVSHSFTGAEMPGGIDLTRPPWVGTSDQVASVAGAWDGRPRVHTAHKGACGSGPQTVAVLWNGCAGVITNGVSLKNQ